MYRIIAIRKIIEMFNELVSIYKNEEKYQSVLSFWKFARQVRMDSRKMNPLSPFHSISFRLIRSHRRVFSIMMYFLRNLTLMSRNYLSSNDQCREHDCSLIHDSIFMKNRCQSNLFIAYLHFTLNE